jgi:hypothetical protein
VLQGRHVGDVHAHGLADLLADLAVQKGDGLQPLTDRVARRMRLVTPARIGQIAAGSLVMKQIGYY